MAEREEIEKRENMEDMHMADLPPYPDSNGDTSVGPDRGSPPGTPRWLKVFGIIALVIILLIVIALATGLGGPHGPGRHSPSGGSGIEPVSIIMYSGGDPGSYTPLIAHAGQPFTEQGERRL